MCHQSNKNTKKRGAPLRRASLPAPTGTSADLGGLVGAMHLRSICNYLRLLLISCYYLHCHSVAARADGVTCFLQVFFKGSSKFLLLAFLDFRGDGVLDLSFDPPPYMVIAILIRSTRTPGSRSTSRTAGRVHDEAVQGCSWRNFRPNSTRRLYSFIQKFR